MTFDISNFKSLGPDNNRYLRHLEKLKLRGVETNQIEKTVPVAITHLVNEGVRAFVIYGEPQSGKTEMMIALTGSLLDHGKKVIVLLLNDSVQLLSQNLDRFRKSGLNPAPRTFTEILDPSIDLRNSLCVVFCKKNAKDLKKLIDKLSPLSKKIVIDDEADYATPNAKVNSGDKTKINELIERLLGNDGQYIGVTATPARLDLNRTFDNAQESWIDFPAHSKYAGKDIFFPTTLDGIQNRKFRLNLLSDDYDQPKHLRVALFSFLVSVAEANGNSKTAETNYSMLIHTSGAKVDHTVDRKDVESIFQVLKDSGVNKFNQYVKEIWDIASERFPRNAGALVKYIVNNITRYAIVVMNSDFDKKNGDYETATDPSTLFTIAIGGNIVSRGVTFNSLLSMYFTRDTKHKIQQDTYIQRARMFGSRSYPLHYFELTIPRSLYEDWHRCFVYHSLAINSIRANKGAPVWLGDQRISPVATSSIDRSRLNINSGEMSFSKFKYSEKIEAAINGSKSESDKLKLLRDLLGDDKLPDFLLDFVKNFSPDGEKSLAIHASKPITGYSDADDIDISRKKGLIGKSDREETRFPDAIHHFKIFINSQQDARVFYRYEGNRISFFQTK
jgi:hypothetical protein